MSTSFFWHDYETFGLSPRRDRPAQFAGLRTDAQLREIGEPLTLYCKPAPDTLPQPEACLLTGILPQTAEQRGVAEHAFAAAIEAELAQPGTIGVGYNSIRFDDEVTRFLFWRNLIDPYAREWQNGCGRWDLLDVVRTVWALRPEGIEWPQHDDGRPSFKLEQLSAANGLAHESAHDALSDVRATLALARLVRERKPRLWAFCLGLRSKARVQEELAAARSREGAFLHLSGRYPAERGCMAVVWPLAPHPVNRNELIVWDLAQDPALLRGLDAAAIRARIFSAADALPQGTQRLPIKTIHINRAPVVIANLGTLTPPVLQRWQLDLDAARRHAEQAARVADEMAGVWGAVYARERDDAADAVDVDEDLYGGFLGDDDRRSLQRLRGLDGAALASRRVAFTDGRLDELLFRFRARNFPATLDADEQARWLAHCAARLHHGAGGALTLAAFFERIDALSENVDERGEAILGALYDWAERIAPPA